MVTTNDHSMRDRVSWEVQIPSEIGECRRVVDEVISRAQSLGVSSEEIFAVRNGLHEAVVNAVRHGNRHDPSKTVRILCEVTHNAISVEVEDQGSGFDETTIADPRTDQNRSRDGGRGLMLMRHFMSSVEFNARGNCVRMTRSGVRN